MADDRWFVFLRAINTGNRRLTNDQLLAPFRALDFGDVAAYQAAGNVTFRSAEPVDEATIEQVLADAYGFDTPTFVRSAAEIAAVVAAEPFSPDALAATPGKVQVSFLRTEPTADRVADLAGLTPAEDRIVVIGREWFWLPVEGVSTSKLPVGRVEELLGTMTMRTHGTVQRMAARFG